jgi:RNA polymerase sigma-70 factor (ECF subfamily)
MAVNFFHDESELLAKLAEGEQHVFKLIYDRYNKKVYTVVVKMLQSDMLAEELTQEVFLKLWKLQQHFSSFGHLEAWLRTTARNLSLNAFRRILLEKKADKELTINYREDHNDTEETVLLNDARGILDDAIAQLPTQQREVYKLCQVEGMKYEEAAIKLNISINTVKTHMKRAVPSVRGYVQSHLDVAIVIILLKLF